MREYPDVKQPRYEQIATDIAQKIVREEFYVGQKLSGRSLLAGTYNVSPETIRRSIALLQNIGVVEAVSGSGIVIKSSVLAKEYLTEYNERQKIINLRNRINDLLLQRRELDEELETALAKLLEFSFHKSSILQQIEEIPVPPTSWIIGKTIAATNIRGLTGATVVAVKRQGQEIFSPGADFVFDGDDTMVIVGTVGAKKRARESIMETCIDLQDGE